MNLVKLYKAPISFHCRHMSVTDSVAHQGLNRVALPKNTKEVMAVYVDGISLYPDLYFARIDQGEVIINDPVAGSIITIISNYTL